MSNVIMKAAELTSAMRDLWTSQSDIKVGDEKVGAIIGGQILPEAPDEESFRKTARELGIMRTSISPHL